MTPKISRSGKQKRSGPVGVGLHVPEAEIQGAILQYLQRTRLVFWRQNLGAVLRTKGGRTIKTPNPMAGFPDIAGVTPSGKFWAMEVKSKDGTLSALQKEWLKTLSDSGVAVRVVYSIDEAIAFVKELLKGGDQDGVDCGTTDSAPVYRGGRTDHKARLANHF